ncbi:hypothetical protein [Rhizobium phaseoli]|uniref:hypothetical protein n=1 Tax=Rhizobium phaseoli TaxID=396 RepID=UPI0007F15DF7|nr:hypothetical protein [Rhizobium phaseoli]ANL36869.1 hypothetical protein AMC89_PB00177 [Rhizobium phaseoli]ANM00592.1 hypothetical protein AMC79_PB00177 [Rhizobium phaseoli]
MANTIFQTRSDASTATPRASFRSGSRCDGGGFTAVSFLLCMALGFVAPEWGLHRPWRQFYLGLTGFDLWSVVLGTAQSLIFGGYAGALLGTIFNVISRRFG